LPQNPPQVNRIGTNLPFRENEKAQHTETIINITSRAVGTLDRADCKNALADPVAGLMRVGELGAVDEHPGKLFRSGGSWCGASAEELELDGDVDDLEESGRGGRGGSGKEFSSS
ncbi:hypothetical protein, partial [Streptomyces sp. NPDC001719]